MSMNLEQIARGVRMILEGIDIDLSHPDFVETPNRVARMYAEILHNDEITLRTFPTDYKGMVIVRHHIAWGLCPHHLMPIKYDVSLGYIPSKRALGLSKLPRIINLHTHQPVLQETLTQSLVTVLSSTKPKPLGVMAVVKGEHGCMGIRGVRSHSDTLTSAISGKFQSNPIARQEFLALLDY